MQQAVILPVLIPFFTAITCLLLWRWRMAQRVLGLAGSVALLTAGLELFTAVNRHGILVLRVAGWPPPFGITFVADLFSAIMVVLAGIVGLTTLLYSLVSVDRGRETFGYYPLLHLLLMGVCGAFLTGDIFNLYVWFEVMLISSFVLLALGGERPQLEGAIKYVTLNLISSALFLAAVGILYGITGSLNMADLAQRLDRTSQQGLVTTAAMLFFVAFGIKAAVFPLFFWLPASYHTPPVAVSAIFAGLLTKVGVYALVRAFTLLFVQDASYTHSIILAVSGLTMTVGVLGAIAQNEFRRILSFHIVSQIGYMILGLGLFTPLGLAGTVFYIAHHIIVKTNLFLISGLTYRFTGSFELKLMGGVYKSKPIAALLFLIPAMSLAGWPPLSGFFAKLILLKAGFELGQYAIASVALAVSLLTLFSMAKIWNEVFWKPAKEGAETVTENTEDRDIRGLTMLGYYGPVATLAAITVTIGLGAGFFFGISERAAVQLLDRAGYVAAVLNASR